MRLEAAERVLDINEDRHQLLSGAHLFTDPFGRLLSYALVGGSS